MSESPRIWFECEEGYPTDESIERLEKHEFDLGGAKEFLTVDLPEIAKGISCLSVDTEETADDWGKPVTRIRYVTGGWSGAEDLIHAMLGHFLIKYHHVMWQRGGLFVFEVPTAIRQQEKP